MRIHAGLPALALSVGLSLTGTAQAITYSVDAGELALNSRFNQFYSYYTETSDGQLQAAAFYYAESHRFAQSAETATIAPGEVHRFEWLFSVSQATTLSENISGLGFAQSPLSVQLMQGDTVLITLQPKAGQAGLGVNYAFPTTALAAQTPYRLLVSMQGPTELDQGFAWGALMALDVSAPAPLPVPEPASALLMLAGLLGLPLLARRRAA